MTSTYPLSLGHIFTENESACLVYWPCTFTGSSSSSWSCTFSNPHPAPSQFPFQSLNGQAGPLSSVTSLSSASASTGSLVIVPHTSNDKFEPKSLSRGLVSLNIFEPKCLQLLVYTCEAFSNFISTLSQRLNRYLPIWRCRCTQTVLVQVHSDPSQIR